MSSRYVSVPLVRYSTSRDDILVQLERLGADRVFLCTGRGLAGDEEHQEQTEQLKDGEYFPDENEHTPLSNSAGLYDVKLRDGAKVLSYYKADGQKPCAYTYENGSGKRFYVICADMDLSRDNSSLRRSYSRQLIAAYEWLCGSKLPAVCTGNPDLYMLCKQKGGKLAVGLWNFFEDSIPRAQIALGRRYSDVEFINCSGRLEGDKILLDTEIAAFGFAGFEVSL